MNSATAKPPERGRLSCPGSVKRIGSVTDLCVRRFDVHAIDNSEPTGRNQIVQFGSRSETEVFGNVREDQPRFSPVVQMRCDTSQEALQHRSSGVVDGVFDGRGGLGRNPGRIADHQRSGAFGKEVCFHHVHLIDVAKPREVGARALQFDGDCAGEDVPRAVGQYMNLRKLSIYGGSNEIQRNIIAQMVLQL